MKTLGKVVQEWRASQRPHMSVAELARKVGVDYQNIQHLEAGDVERPRYLPELAAAMGMSVEDLISRKRRGNVAAVAHPVSHPAPEHRATVAEVGNRQSPMSFDDEFARLSPTEQRRWLLLWAAAFDHPPDAIEQMEGIWSTKKDSAQSHAVLGPGTPGRKVAPKGKREKLG